jgi:hypothetical protein
VKPGEIWGSGNYDKVLAVYGTYCEDFLFGLDGHRIIYKPVTTKTAVRNESIPSVWKSAISAILVVHFGLFAVTCLSALTSSSQIDKLLLLSAKYLSPLHLRLDSLPLVNGDEDIDDWPHHLEWRTSALVPWQAMPTTRYSQTSERMQRLIRAAGAAAAIEDTATAAMLVKPFYTELIHDSQEVGNVDGWQLRLVAQSPRGELLPRWEAAIVLIEAPSGDSTVQLLTLSERRLNASNVVENQTTTDLLPVENRQ